MADRFAKGLEVIRLAAVDALRDRGVTDATVACDVSGTERAGASLTISARDSVHTQTFSYDEIEDSGEAIDAPSAIKVRMLVSRFV